LRHHQYWDACLAKKEGENIVVERHAQLPACMHVMHGGVQSRKANAGQAIIEKRKGSDKLKAYEKEGFGAAHSL
jgi:hypothetical protein